VRERAAAAVQVLRAHCSRSLCCAARRRESLKKSALMKYPTLAQRREDQAFELGWRLQKGRAPEGTRRAQQSAPQRCHALRATQLLTPARAQPDGGADGAGGCTGGRCDARRPRPVRFLISI
jgi:hypothetical protein